MVNDTKNNINNGKRLILTFLPAIFKLHLSYKKQSL